MSDTTTATHKRRSFAGPIVLIVIGVVFLLGNIHVISWFNLAQWFARFWPVLIILWGLVKLVEYYQARREGYQAPGIGAGGFFLIFFLIILGLAATSAQRVNWRALRGEVSMDDNFSSIFGATFTFNQALEQDVPATITAVHINSDRGDVSVIPWDQAKVKIVVHKKVISDNQDEANKADKATAPVITTADNIMTISANASGAGDSVVKSDLEIYIPKKGSLEIATRGDVAVRGRQGDVKISTSRGDVSIEDITGSATISLRHGSLTASRVTGDVALDGTVRDSKINNVSGAVHLSGRFTGDTVLAKIAKGVTVKLTNTDMELAKLDGELNIQIGDLRASSVTGPVRLVTRSKDIRIDDVSGDLHLENSNGEVEVHAAKLPLGTIKVENRKGEITVTLPSDAGFQISAHTRRGDIESDFPGLKIDTNHGESTATGSIGNGAARVQINNEYGNISVRKAG